MESVKVVETKVTVRYELSEADLDLIVRAYFADSAPADAVASVEWDVTSGGFLRGATVKFVSRSSDETPL
jgi:hypothetical protein